MARSQVARKRKQRLSLSLSSEAAEYLRAYCVQARMPSLSASVEVMVAHFRRAREMNQLGVAVKAYYDSLSDREAREESAWGEFTETELAESEP